MLDQVGSRAMALGDVDTATDAFRLGVDMARQEMYRGELDSPFEAMLLFSEKLADAMTNLGNEAGAEGVLREAVSFAEPKGERTARILHRFVKQLLIRKQHPEEIARTIDRAIEAAQSCSAEDLLHDLRQWKRQIDRDLTR